jgi:outer membrane protein insertion porin family
MVTFLDMKIRIGVISIFAAGLILLAAVVQAQEPQLELLGLAVEGNTQADAGLIVATSGLVVGETLTGEKIQNAIRQLWKLNLFSDIKVAVERQTADGVYILIRVKENPRLEAIEIVGGKKLGKEELEKAVDLQKGQVVTPSDPTHLRRKLKRLADSKGYLLADFDIQVKEGSSDGYADLSVRIREGRKVKVKEILFDGNRAFSNKKLRKQMKSTKRKSLFRSGEFKADKFDEDKTALMDFYRENGYRDANILADSIWYTEDLKRMYIVVSLEEGDRYYFGDVTFEGNRLFTDDELQRQLLFRAGDVFNQKRYDISIKERLSSLYYDKGYIYAQIIPMETPAGQDTVDVSIHIEPGNRFNVRNINITGNTKTNEKVIRREFVLKPGDTFDVSRLRRSIRDVAILNYFADVQPDVEDVSDKEVDLFVKVEERPTDQANVSAGYSERDGLIGALGFTAPNLFGTGQQLSVDWNFGSRYGSFSISYTEPWFLNTETSVGGSFYNMRRRWTDGFTEKLVGGSVSLGRRFAWPDDYFRGDWSYRVEHSKYGDLSDDLRSRVLSGATQLDTLARVSSSITQVISRDSRDFPEFPTQGSVLRLSTEVSGGLLSGDDRYHKHIFSVDWYTPIRPKLVLYNQMLIGYLDGFTRNPRDIPLLEYFYMGGAGLTLGTPLRGYDERTIGPSVSGTRTAAGGKSQFKVTGELRIQLVDNPTIYGLGFAEAGNTWRNFQQTDIFNLRRSAGLGIRLYMPMIGLIGLDYGYGMDADAGGHKPGWTPHFQFGRTF